MSRGYGYVGGRRTGGAAWQWIIIGAVLGFGCSVILALAALAFGLVTLDPNAVADLPTQTPFIITATPQPVTPTIAVEPTEPAATATEIRLEIQAPTASPTIDPTFITLAAPTTAPTNASGGGLGGGLANEFTAQNATPAGGNTGTGGDALFNQLQSIITDTVRVEGGTFQMGTTAAEVSAAVNECLAGYGGEPGACDVSMGEDSFPEHAVTISPFNMEVYEVSYAQYLTFINLLGPGAHRNGCNGQPCLQTRTESETSNITYDGATYSVPSVINDFPMTNVTWYGAQAYCEAIGRRLPTEAEWERAARGPNNNIFPWGNTWDATRASTRRPADGGEPQKVPVFAFPEGSSPYGIYNLAGNVAEWVLDWYDPRFYGRPEATVADPTGPTAGQERVTRGGSWDTMPFFSRSVHRQSQEPNNPTADIGFRCVEDLNNTNVPNNPIGAGSQSGSGDIVLPTQGSAGANEEDSGAGGVPTIPPLPATATPVVTLAPGG